MGESVVSQGSVEMGGCCSKWDPGRQAEKKNTGGDTPKLNRLEHKESFAGQKGATIPAESGNHAVQTRPMADTPPAYSEKKPVEKASLEDVSIKLTSKEPSKLETTCNDVKNSLGESGLSPEETPEIIDSGGTSMTTVETKEEESPSSAVQEIINHEQSHVTEETSESSTREKVTTMSSSEVKKTSVMQSSATSNITKMENFNEIQASSSHEISKEQEMSSFMQSSKEMEATKTPTSKFLDPQHSGPTLEISNVQENIIELSNDTKTVSSVQESSVIQNSSSVKVCDVNESVSSQQSCRSETSLSVAESSSVSQSFTEQSEKHVTQEASENYEHKSSTDFKSVSENTERQSSEKQTSSKSESVTEKSTVVKSSVSNSVQSEMNSAESFGLHMNIMQQEASNSSLSSKEHSFEVSNDKSENDIEISFETQKANMIKSMANEPSMRNEIETGNVTSDNVTNLSVKKMSSSSSSTQSSSVKTMSVSSSDDKEPVVSCISEENTSKTESAAVSEATVVNGEVVSSLDEAESSHEENASLTIKDNNTEEHMSTTLIESKGMKSENGVAQISFQNSSEETKSVNSITQNREDLAQGEFEVEKEGLGKVCSFSSSSTSNSTNKDEGESDDDDNLPPPPLEDIPSYSIENDMKSVEEDTPLPPVFQDHILPVDPSHSIDDNSHPENENSEEVDSVSPSHSSYVGLISPSGFSSSAREETESSRKMFTSSLLTSETTEIEEVTDVENGVKETESNSNE